jgi:threonine aldolase
MKNRLIDLFSDTATRPSAGMRKAMAEAEVGDEQRGEDPTTRALEERVAALLGKEAAVFLPSGTMCNQIALAVHCQAGDEIIAADKSHIFNYEAGGGAVTARAHNWPIKTSNGIFSGADVAAAVRPVASRHHPRSRLVVIEQTQNLGGGAVWTLAEIADVAGVAQSNKLALHMDGARLPNAVAASGIAAAKMTEPCDSVWFDLSKGLGCPIGGVLAGSKEFINEAWRWKHRLGGAMRQSGIIAAAGIYALDHNVTRLSDDHANAKRLADVLGPTKGVTVLNPKVETNLLFLDVSATGRSAPDISAALLQKGVRIGAMTPIMLRAVTHLDVSPDDIEIACKAWRDVMI